MLNLTVSHRNIEFLQIIQYLDKSILVFSTVLGRLPCFRSRHKRTYTGIVLMMAFITFEQKMVSQTFLKITHKKNVKKL